MAGGGAKPPGGGRAGPSEPAKWSGPPSRAVAVKGGNFIVDWIAADGQGGKKEITVDPGRHGVGVPWASQKAR